MDRREALREILLEAELDIELEEGEFRVARPFGGGDAVVFDPDSFLADLPEAKGQARRALTAYASGIRQVLLEPADSDAHELDFTEVAGQLGMALHAAPFLAGAAAASGREPWSSQLTGDLHFVCFIELDRGVRVLTRDQFERWSATTDRLISGARSMLFHKGQQTSPEPVDEREPVEKLDVGDGYDAARILVLGDLMYGEFGDSSRFAMPTPGDLYFVREGTSESVEQLRKAAEDRVAASDYPLSSRLFRLERGQPEAVGGDS